MSSLFGAAGSNSFATSTNSQPQQTSSLFGTSTSAAAPSLGFGAPVSSQPQTSSLFGNAAPAAAPSNTLFGNTTAQTGGLFAPKSTPQPASTSLFGNQNAQPTKSLFGGAGAATQSQQQQGMLPPQPDVSQYMMDSRRIWKEEDGAPRSRTVLEQLQIVNKKWDPSHPQHAFQAFLYNQVDPAAAPFYRPGPGENEEAWEDALRKAPSAGSIPFRVRGFFELGRRIVQQQAHLELLSGRLHEINEGLTVLLRKHELDITTRAAAARRRHAALSQRVLTLATKTMVARNRGYQLDPAEEQLRKRLGDLERAVTDPAIAGREEEIWARMVQVREQGRKLELEMERAGLTQNGEKPQELNEEVVKQAEKVLKDYDKQLAHLSKEMEQIKQDWEEWASSKTATNGDSRR